MTEANEFQPLSAYGVSDVTGFVPEREPLRRLPEGYDSWEALVPDLSALIRTRRLRPMLRELQPLDPLSLSTEAERERGLLLLTYFANGWVWGGEDPDLNIPGAISVPLCRLASAMGRPPIAHYASAALQNWRLLDRRRPISADNMTMQVQFLGGVDEDWFFIGSLGVELAGAPLMMSIRESVVASSDLDDHSLETSLEKVANDIEPVIDALVRMTLWCDPYIFFHRVRPFLNGWPEPGAMYEGAYEAPIVHAGGSAGQSSLIQAVDAALGVEHRPQTADYLRRLRDYMPPLHRQLVNDFASRSRIRHRVGAGTAGLKSAYNGALRQLDRFRQQHMSLAITYVAKQSSEPGGAKGTGGTDLAKFLQSTRNSTTDALL